MKLLPFPRVWLVLVVMWLILQGNAAPGQLLLGAVVATIACWAVQALEPPNSHPRRIGIILALIWLVLKDVVLSNVAVIGLLVSGRQARSAFVSIPLALKDPNGLAILACIVTATPGSAWIEYDSTLSKVTIHVLDVDDEAAWSAALKQNYEQRLLEIFQ